MQLNKVHRLEFAPVPGVITAKPQCPPQQFRKFEAVGALILRSTFVIKAIKANHRGVSALHFHGALLGAAFPGDALTYICECIEFAGLKPFTSSWDGIKVILQQPRVQGPKHNELLPTTWGCSDPPDMDPKILWYKNFPSDLQQLRDQQQQFTEASHPQDKNSLPSLPPAPVTSFTLFCTYKVVSQWQRKKKKRHPQHFFL